MECDCPQWSAEALAVIKEQAAAALAKYGLRGPTAEVADCLRCGQLLNVQRDGNFWSVDCRCGWSAAGSSPRPN